MTGIEKFANSLLTVLVARGAMVATPFVATALVWFGSSWLDNRFDTMTRALDGIGTRVDTLETRSSATVSKVQEHQFRLENGRVETDEFRATVIRQFEKFDQTLSDQTLKLQAIDGSVIKLGTIISERVPRRESLNQESLVQP